MRLEARFWHSQARYTYAPTLSVRFEGLHRACGAFWGVEARCAFLPACHSQARRTYAENSCFEGFKKSVRLKSKTKENKLFDFLGRLHPSKPTIQKALLDFSSRLNMLLHCVSFGSYGELTRWNEIRVTEPSG